jgi:hypothetical protein
MEYNRILVDSVLHIPALADTNRLHTTNTSPQIGVLNNKLLYYSGHWREAGNGSGSSYSFTTPLTESSGVVGIPYATGSVNGYLKYQDWNTFNNKMPLAFRDTLQRFGSGNIKIGISNIRPSNVSGNSNIAIGDGTLYNISDGYSNTSVGYYSSNQVNHGINNTALGYYSLTSSTGNNNTAIGSYAGKYNTSKSHRLWLGGIDYGSEAGDSTKSPFYADLNTDMSKQTVRLNGVVTVNGNPIGSTYTASNGITLTGSDFQLGGTYSNDTKIESSNSKYFWLTSHDVSYIGNANFYLSDKQINLYFGHAGIHLTDTTIDIDANYAINFSNPINVAGNIKIDGDSAATTNYVRAHSGGSGSTQLEDTLYISSANILSGINDTLINTSSSTTKMQNIYTTCLISYKHVSIAYTGGTTDTIAVFGKYKGVKKKLLYISSSYITDAASGRGQFPIAWDKLDPGSPIWVHIPSFSAGNGILRLRFKKLTENW